MNAERPVAAVFAYALWPLLTLTVVALWAAAALDILRHKRRGTFNNAGLLGMAAIVSVIAIVAISGIHAVFADQWSEAMSRASLAGVEPGKTPNEAPDRAYVFSFGLENASYGPTSEPKGKNRVEERQPR